ncbi:MAG TPA: undecaprenyldiphospho-muramoylpentapeptide beta-N-acetylglucosaminyltransferase [Acidimicrobiales bacterium]|nr:undecaprenyldiphospho-muramoylpentapeptide beta-N-acetylglucosaminyltransferase [Acidimicrobiales bacterium]
MIAGGGTGGHVVPAIAIGQALVARGHAPGEVRFVGSRRGVEGRMVPDAGFEVTLLPGRGIARRLTPANLGAVAGLVLAVARAVVLIGRLRPRVVVSVGGYASVPCAAAAALWRVPLVVAEQNAVPGLANRLAARVARASAVSFAGTPLPRAELTGNPVRREVVEADRSPGARAAARAAMGVPVDATVVAVVGGSLGARRINDATLDLAGRWAERGGWVLHHVVGPRDWAEVAGRAPVPVDGGLDYRPVRFEDRMATLYAAADVAVCRAGASTVAELGVVGLPSVLVPLPGAPGDHQTANARRFEAAGAAVVIADAEATGDRLAAEIDGLVGDPDRLEAMGRAAAALGRPGAADAVAALAERHARA